VHGSLVSMPLRDATLFVDRRAMGEDLLGVSRKCWVGSEEKVNRNA